ncbi:hypothetical protein AVEN_19067-1 [Araneus ventricosus]|uniref:Uncharacterized protein n=1 Tax=Araneus ventricosus TaxID=182803 RepID=A0A4Y2T0M7_ARAVE|nr:hypothetical protein AVEN_68692-1 [Araneus ventricosus]GBN94235.1 hypothetical protein AVEN_19067-1 [Araneus ventricosus]
MPGTRSTEVHPRCLVPSIQQTKVHLLPISSVRQYPFLFFLSVSPNELWNGIFCIKKDLKKERKNESCRIFPTSWCPLSFPPPLKREQRLQITSMPHDWSLKKATVRELRFTGA